MHQGADVSGLVALEAIQRVLERSHTRLQGRLVLGLLDQTWAKADGHTAPSIFQGRVLTKAMHQVMFMPLSRACSSVSQRVL